MALDPITAGIETLNTVIERVFPDPQQATTAKLKLAEMQQNGELEAFKAESNDKTSARNREVEIAKAGHKDNITPTLAIFITIGFFMLLLATFFLPIQAGMLQVANILIGTLGSAWIQVVSYYFGSSLGSKNKEMLIANQGNIHNVDKQSHAANGK